MYLKSLELQGFKSFPDKIRLTFDEGLTAVVGPNGSGKSNIGDAVRWVLGEQRPTALRCSKLVDVVFNGTDTRKPLGLAEVSITFAECEKELGTEYNEVTITRRVYRDGSGEYFINKQACRLKDVQHLFMGTGIGTSSYSVMAQGQIDAILSSKPEDRRAVFEEAAGITKFRYRKEESERKLDACEENLGRIRDIITELENQVRAIVDGPPVEISTYPRQIAFNVLPQIDKFTDTGYTKEELKMLNEGRKIRGLPELNVTCTCVRVPVYRSHSISCIAQFEKPVDVEGARGCFAGMPGVELMDDVANNVWPTPLDSTNGDTCYVGRIRKDISNPNGLTFWLVSDQIKKGAALNAVQIAEWLIQNDPKFQG